MITVDNQAIQLNYNLRELEKMDPYFFRAHRSYLINPGLVRNVDLLNHQIIFRTGATCPVSRRKANKLLALLKK